MTSPDKPIFDASKGFDFQEPALSSDLVDQLFISKTGVPEHYSLRDDLRPEPPKPVEATVIVNLKALSPQPAA